ncbi:MAG: FAD-dependent oxidoreductase [Planctomycetota bacterium]
MKNPIFLPSTEWPVIGEYDVVVVGAGPGGVGAAVGAARLGQRTLIVEKYGFPGGVAAIAECPYLMGYAAEGRQIVGGVADELVRELDRMGQAGFAAKTSHTPERRPIVDRPILDNVITSVEAVRIADNRLLERAGVARLYYTSLIGAVVEKDRLTAVAVDCVEGPGLIRARCFVDATGDANLVNRAGGEVREGSVEDTMTKTLLIRVGGVSHYHCESAKQRYKQLAQEKKTPFHNQDQLMSLGLLNPGEVSLNFTLAAGNGLLSSELTRMDIAMREQILIALDFFRREMPEFVNCYLVDAACGVGVRAGRSIVGMDTITQKDIDDGTPVAEPVALGTRGYGGHGIDSFRQSWCKWQKGLRAIPMKTLIPKSFANVTAAGRAISCEVRVVSTFRLMSRCMAIGQAAGVMAALAAKSGKAIPDVPYRSVREELLKQNAILE